MSIGHNGEASRGFNSALSGERIMEELQSDLKLGTATVEIRSQKAVPRAVIWSKRGVFGFNRYTSTRPRRVLYYIYKRFCHFYLLKKKRTLPHSDILPVIFQFQWHIRESWKKPLMLFLQYKTEECYLKTYYRY